MKNTLYQLAGPAALGTRLRKLADSLLNDAEQLYRHYQVPIDPRWFPVLYMLGRGQSMTVSALAEQIGHSHAAVSQVVKQMSAAGLVSSEPCAQDARANHLSLTEQGQQAAIQLDVQVTDVNTAIAHLFDDSGTNLCNALDAIEYALAQQGLHPRVMRVESSRVMAQVRIESLREQHIPAFKSLNEHWIETHFDLEDEDRKALEQPLETIIKPGGYIAVALLAEVVVGTCALICKNNGDLELAKMAVADAAKGKGIGFKLGQHVIEKARTLGAHQLFLETNSKLQPAINLYRKLGFKPCQAQASPYQRCDIQMTLSL